MSPIVTVRKTGFVWTVSAFGMNTRFARQGRAEKFAAKIRNNISNELGGILVAVENGYRSGEQKATDDMEKLKWRNCSAAVKVVGVKFRLAIGAAAGGQG